MPWNRSTLSFLYPSREWLGYLRRDGKPTEPPCKGHTYKGAFHVMRMLAKVLTVLREA